MSTPTIRRGQSPPLLQQPPTNSLAAKVSRCCKLFFLMLKQLYYWVVSDTSTEVFETRNILFQTHNYAKFADLWKYAAARPVTVDEEMMQCANRWGFTPPDNLDQLVPNPHGGLCMGGALLFIAKWLETGGNQDELSSLFKGGMPFEAAEIQALYNALFEERVNTDLIERYQQILRKHNNPQDFVEKNRGQRGFEGVKYASLREAARRVTGAERFSERDRMLATLELMDLKGEVLLYNGSAEQLLKALEGDTYLISLPVFNGTGKMVSHHSLALAEGTLFDSNGLHARLGERETLRNLFAKYGWKGKERGFHLIRIEKRGES